MNLSKKEKIAALAVATYLGIMMVGMYYMHYICGTKYGNPRMVLSLVGFDFFATLSAIIYYRKFFKGTSFNKPKLNFWIVELVLSAIILAGLQLYFGDFAGKNMTLIWTAVATMLFAGIGEELLFRGILMNAVREKRGIYVAILVSAIVFGFLHSTNLLGGQDFSNTMKQVLSAGVTGVLYAWTFYKTKNVIPTMIYHWFWDLFILMGLIVPVTQTSTFLTVQNLFVLGASSIILIYVIIKIIKEKKSKQITP